MGTNTVVTPDHFMAIVNLMSPIFHYGAIALFVWLLAVITGENPIQLGAKFSRPFINLVKFPHTMKSLNALIDILAFIIIVLLYISPLRELFIPELKNPGGANKELISQGIISFVFVSYLVAGVACLWFCDRADRN